MHNLKTLQRLNLMHDILRCTVLWHDHAALCLHHIRSTTWFLRLLLIRARFLFPYCPRICVGQILCDPFSRRMFVHVNVVSKSWKTRQRRTGDTFHSRLIAFWRFIILDFTFAQTLCSLRSDVLKLAVFLSYHCGNITTFQSVGVSELNYDSF